MPQMRAVMSGGSVAAAEQRLEEARRLVDAQLHFVHVAVPDAHVHCTLTLHPRQCLGSCAWSPSQSSWLSLSARNGPAFALKVRIEAYEIDLVGAQPAASRTARLFGVSIGP